MAEDVGGGIIQATGDKTDVIIRTMNAIIVTSKVKT